MNEAVRSAPPAGVTARADERRDGALLHLSGLTKSFGGEVAVHPVTLDIGAGEYVTLLGPSGCGKTTLLRMIAGLERPTGGTIRLGGRDLTADRPEHRPFNMVFQSYALFPHLDVFDNVAYGLRANGVGETEIGSRVAAALDMVGLRAQARRKVDQLSGGMSQRVALVRAIVNRPKVLLLDEPLAALDLQLRKRMQIELRAIQEQVGTTFIHVTHDQEEALVLSDRVVLMRAGHIVQVGTPRSIYDRPQTHFAARFIGDTSFVPCTVVGALGSAVEVAFGTGARHAFDHHGSAPGAGRGAEVSLRPQHMGLVPPGAGTFDGTIAGVMFTGAATDVVVELDGGTRLRVRAGDGPVGSRGDAVGVAIQPGKGIVVEPDQG